MPGSPTIRFRLPCARSETLRRFSSSNRDMPPYSVKNSFASVNVEYIFVIGAMYIGDMVCQVTVSVTLFLVPLIGPESYHSSLRKVMQEEMAAGDRKSTRLNSSHIEPSRMPSS